MSKEIRDRIRELAQSTTVRMEVATVVSVDEDDRTIVAQFDDLDIANIRLSATISADSQTYSIQYPKINSDVLIAEIQKGSWFVFGFSEIQKTHYKGDNFELVIEDGKIKLNAAEMVINGGDNRGFVKVTPLTETLQKITQWIINIDAVIRNVPVVTTAPGTPDALQIVLKAAIAANQIGQVPNLENDKLKH